MDGSLINNYFSNSVPGIAGRDQFNTSLFKGNIFSSGGYSALYGQALSGIDAGKCGSSGSEFIRFGVSPYFLMQDFRSWEIRKTILTELQQDIRLSLMQKVFNFNTDFIDAPQG
jgi:hypothetical protein